MLLRKIQSIVLILFCIVIMSYAKDDDEAITPEQAKLFLMQRMIPKPGEAFKISAEGVSFFTAVDTLLQAHIQCKFKSCPTHIWMQDSITIIGLSALSDNGFVPIMRDAASSMSPQLLKELAQLMIYPFSIAAGHFRGYILRPLKTPTEVSGIKCIKITVKPNMDDNDEKTPLTGNFYISADDEHRLVRVEHSKILSGVEQTIRWEFKKVKNFDFPYKLTASVGTAMCGFDMSSTIKVYFSDIMPIDSSAPATPTTSNPKIDD